MRLSKRKLVFSSHIYWIIFVILGLLAAVSVFQGIKNAIGTVGGSFDFQYDSALLLRLKINPYDETVSLTGLAEKMGLYEYYGNVEANQFPSLLAILVPLTFLKPYAANVVWVIINLVLTGIVIILSYKLFFKALDKRIVWMLAFFMLAGTGWRNHIGNGQHTIFSFAFFLIALWLSEMEKPVLAGIALAISYFKYTLTLPLALFFVYKKKYKELAVSVGLHIVATLICAWWLNDSVINVIKKPLEISGMLSSDGYIDFGSIFRLSSNVSMAVAILVCLFMFVLLLLGTKENEGLFFTILIYIALIIIYHRIYDFFVLIVPVGIFISIYRENKINCIQNQPEIQKLEKNCRNMKIPEVLGSSRKWTNEKKTGIRNVLNVVFSVCVYTCANFIQKIVDVISSRMAYSETFISCLTTMFALTVYVFVGYLVGQYIMNIRKSI